MYKKELDSSALSHCRPATSAEVIQNAPQRAFTLVELAIVIVIIGLLVGGVLQGQELIRQAGIRTAIKEVESYKTAIISFKGKYNFLPGDLPNAPQLFGYTCGTTLGTRGDGIIQWSWNTTCGTEQMEFWRQLGLSNFIKGSYPGLCGASCSNTVSNQFPDSSAFSKAFYIVQYGARADTASGVYGQLKNFLTLNGQSDNTSGWNLYGPALSQEDAFSIESKIDDGVPSTGNILTSRMISTAGGASITSTTCVDNSNNFSSISRSSPECMQYITID